MTEQNLKKRADELNEKLQSKEREHAELIIENSCLKANIEKLQKNFADTQKEVYFYNSFKKFLKLSDAELRLKEGEVCENARVSLLTQELEAANKRIESLKSAIKTLDEHSDTLMVNT